MDHAEYVGANPKYIGKRALIRKGKPHKVLAQFDDLNWNVEKCHGWHEFLRKDFKILSRLDRT